MARKRAKRRENFAVAELIDGDELDISVAGRRRAQVYRQNPNGWIRLETIFRSRRTAENEAEAWSGAEPASYGGNRRFLSRVKRVLPQDWFERTGALPSLFVVEVCLEEEPGGGDERTASEGGSEAFADEVGPDEPVDGAGVPNEEPAGDSQGW
ncbi:hypothetical protein [Actinobaculum suis]|uniref:hypothetical protein n=1 Tax=Actinobaculum suis TaxID=1657 RepID=UPI000AB7E3C2|nr:hypothetical protein [Actinobaculum suis]